MAEQIIDKVQVQVEASAKGTSAVFEQLERRLTTLQKALNQIDSANLQKVQKAVSSTNLSVNTSGIDKAQKDVVKGVSKIEQALAGLQAYANAAMSGDSSSMTSFERRVVSIQSAVDVLTQKFKQLGDVKIPTDAMANLQVEMEKTSSHLDSLQKKQQQMTDSGGKPKGGITQDWIDLQIALRDAKDKYDELYAAQKKLVNEGNAWTYPLNPYKEQLGALQEQLNATADSVRVAYAAMNDTPSINPDNSGLVDTTKEAEKARAKLKQMCDNAMKKALDSLKSTLKKIASAITGIGKNADNTFSKGFMKILKYGFGIRSIYVLFRRLRKVVVESFGELQKSGAFVEETRTNIEDLKNSLTVLKYQFGAAFQPIFNAVAPALKALMNNLISVMNTISAFIAKLMGKSSYSKAVLNAAAFADNTGKAAKAQKELNKQLQGFDELNNLTTNKSNPNSGSGGSSDDIPGAVYVTESVDNVLGDFWKDLADKINQGDWKGVGQAISDKLSSAMESIDWDSIYQKARNFGSGLANFLNGLINPRLFGNLGKTLAGALNTALAFLNSFGKTFDFKNFGKSIAEGINQFFKTFNFREFGETLHTWIVGAIDACISFLDTLDFEAIGKAIADFIGGLNIPDLAKKLLELAKKILEALAEAIKSLWNNSSVTGKLAMAIIGLFGVLKLTGLAKTFAGLIGAAISGKTLSIAASGTTVTLTGLQLILSGVATVAAGALMYSAGTSADRIQNNPFEFDRDTGASDWANMGAQWLKGTGSISSLAGAAALLTGGKFWSTFGSTYAKLAPATALWTGGPYLSNNLGKYLSDDPETQKYYDELKGSFSMFETKKTGSIFKGLYRATKEGNLLPGLLNLGFEQAKSLKNLTVGDETTKHNNWMENLYYDAKYSISDFAERWADGSEKWFGPVIEFFDPNSGYMKDLGGIVKSKLKEDVQPIKDIAKAGWDALQSFGDKVVNGAVNIGAKVKNMYKGSYLEEGVNTLKSIFGGDSVGGTNILNAWNGFSESIGKANVSYKSMGETAKNLVEKTKTLVSDTKNFGTEASNSASKAKTGFSDFASNAIGTFSSAYTKGTKTWNGLSKWATTKAKTAGEGFGTFSGVVSGEFETAYTESTNKWLGIKSWANGVTTTTASGMSMLPTDVSKQFGDAYSQSTAKWNDLGKWALGETAIVNGTFSTFPSTASGQFGQAYTDSTNKWSGTKKWANDIFGLVTSASRTKLETIPSIFQSNYQSGTTRAEYQVSNFKSWLDRQDLLRKAGVEPDENKFRNLKSRVSEVTSSLSRVKNNTINVSGSGFEALGNKIRNLTNQIDRLKTKGSISLGSGVGFKMFARGGVVGGATPAIVGEAGPEAILPLTDGTIGKLADMIVGDMAVPQMPVVNNTSINGYGSTNTGSSDITRQNELLAEQNQLLRQIAAKELTVSTKDVFDATRSESNNYYNRTGNSPFLF